MVLARHLKCLDFKSFSSWPKALHPKILTQAATRCTELKKLIFGFGSEYYLQPQVFELALAKFSRLEEVDISRTYKTGDLFLSMIGKHCRKLKVLLAAHCGITDTGIENICIFKIKNYEGVHGQCKSIHHLDISDNNEVTQHGIQIALMHLPLLTVFKFDWAIRKTSSGSKLVLCSDFTHIFSTYSLADIHQHIDGYGGHLSPNTSKLSRAIQLVSTDSITEVIIWMDGPPALTDQELQSFSAMRHLKYLEFHDFRNGTDEKNESDLNRFQEVLTLILQAIGQSLISLNLCLSRGLDVGVIAQLCPKLKTIDLSFRHPYLDPLSHGFRVNELTPLNAFSRLENLRLIGREGSPNPSFSPEDLELFFSSPVLTHIEITLCPALNDRIFQRADDLHGFRRLETLILSRCNNVTRKGIDLLMNGNNPLSILKLFECHSISKEDEKKWNRKIDQEKWQCSITYFLLD